jgi:2-methylcitrate dehydratase PrpD
MKGGDSAVTEISRTLVERIAEWSSSLTLDAVPDDVTHAAKRCIIDSVGVTLAAKANALTQRIVEHANHDYGPGKATALGFRKHLSPVGAALVNGTAGHVLDFDDTSYTGIMHGSVVAMPAALAATEMADGNGRRFLEAFVAGSEVTYAMAMLCTTRHYFKGWWSTATFGIFGAAAAAARAMELSEPETVSALALAGAQASGMKAAFGTDAKPFLAGRAAAIGVESALLAHRGLSAPPGVIEDERGFLSLLNDGYSDPEGINRLGTDWRLVDPGIFFKQYPVCSAAHAAVELTEKRLSDNDIRGDAVEKVICEVPPVVAISLVYNRPETPQEAQFSLPFAIGAMLARGSLGIDCLSQETLSDPHLREAMGKVEMRRVDALDDQKAPEGARVTLVTKDGVEHSGYLGEPKGMPGNPMSDAALHEKFRRCAAAGGSSRTETDELLKHLLAVEFAPSPLNG